MLNNMTEIEIIRKETRNYLRPSDKKEFEKKFGVSQSMISQILTSPKQTGEKSIERLFEMHDRALMNKRRIKEKANQS